MWGERETEGGREGGIRRWWKGSIHPLANKHHTPSWWINHICSCTQWVTAEEELGWEEEEEGEGERGRQQRGRNSALVTGNS